MYLWIILPVTTLVVSIVIGHQDYWGNKKWLVAPILGFMYMLAEYAAFKLENNLATNKINLAEWQLLLVGAGISLQGLLIGMLLARFNKRRSKSGD